MSDSGQEAAPCVMKLPAAMDIETVLREVDIFKRFSRRQIGRLSRLATFKDFPRGTRILRRGDTGVAMYVITTGRVSISLHSEESGRERRIADMGPGDVFGEMALIDEGPRSADVTALEDTRCLLLTRWDFARELRDDPAIAVALLPVLCARIRGLEERLMQGEPEPPLPYPGGEGDG